MLERPFGRLSVKLITPAGKHVTIVLVVDEPFRIFACARCSGIRNTRPAQPWSAHTRKTGSASTTGFSRSGRRARAKRSPQERPGETEFLEGARRARRLLHFSRVPGSVHQGVQYAASNLVDNIFLQHATDPTAGLNRDQVVIGAELASNRPYVYFTEITESNAMGDTNMCIFQPHQSFRA